MPGKIIAQIAMAPEININQYASVVWLGETKQIQAATETPAIKDNRLVIVSLPVSFNTYIADAAINPIKNDHRGIGWWTNRYCISLAKEKMLVRIPPPTATRNFKFTAFVNSLNLPENRSLALFQFSDLIDESSSA